MTLSLTRQESQVLFDKYIALGYTEQESSSMVKKVKKHLKLLQNSLKRQKTLSDEEINQRFYDEYAKLLMEAEKADMGRFE